MLYAHETAHQSWGNVVSTAGYQDDWLLEALANYSALLYLEKHKGVRAMEAVLNEYRADLLATAGNGRTVASAGPIALGSRLEALQKPASRRGLGVRESWVIHAMVGPPMGEGRVAAVLCGVLPAVGW